VRQNTTKGDRGVDECVQLLVAADGKLQVSGRDALDLEILGGVACQFEDFGCQVFQHCCDVDSSFGADAHLVLGLRLEETLDTTAGKLVKEEVLAVCYSVGVLEARVDSLELPSRARRILCTSRFCAGLAKQHATACALSRFHVTIACHVPEVQPLQSAISGSFQSSHHQPCRRSFRQSFL
jgi:hypothetical protein